MGDSRQLHYRLRDDGECTRESVFAQNARKLAPQSSKIAPVSRCPCPCWRRSPNRRSREGPGVRAEVRRHSGHRDGRTAKPTPGVGFAATSARETTPGVVIVGLSVPQRERQDRPVSGDRPGARGLAARLNAAGRARRRDRRRRPERPAARVSAHPGPHPPDVAPPTSRAPSAISRPRSSCSTCSATATRTCAASRSWRAACGCRSASGRARRNAPSSASARSRRRRPRDAAARARRRLGRPDRQGRAIALLQRQAHARLAQDEAPQAAGVRRRRLDRAAPDAQHFGSLLARLLRRAAARCDGPERRHRVRSEGTRSRRGAARRARGRQKSRSPMRSRRPRTRALGQTDAGRRSAVHGMDERRPAAPAGVSRHARRQEGRDSTAGGCDGQSAKARRCKGRSYRDTRGPKGRSRRKAGVARAENRTRPRRSAQSSSACDELEDTQQGRRNRAAERRRRCASRISPRCSGPS